MALGECVVKINEIILEALNKGTGTPNPEFSPEVDKVGNRNSDYEVEYPNGAPDFSGLKQASRGANMLGKGITKGAKAAGNFIASRIPGTTANQQRAGAAEAARASKEWIAKWNQLVGTNPAIQKDTASLHDYASQLARDMSGQQLFDPEMPTDMTPNGVSKYITNVVNRTLVANSTSRSSPSQAGNNRANEILNRLVAQAEQAGDRIGADDVTKELTALNLSPIDRRELTQKILEKLKGYGIDIAAGPHGANPGEAPTLSPGVRIISSDPIVLGYDKRKYALNRQNQWVTFGSSRPASPEMAKFLNKQAQAL